MAKNKFSWKDILLFVVAVVLGFILLLKVLPIVFKFIFWILIAVIILYIAKRLYTESK